MKMAFTIIYSQISKLPLVYRTVYITPCHQKYEACHISFLNRIFYMQFYKTINHNQTSYL